MADIGHNNPPHPERLMAIDVGEIPPLLAEEYRSLLERTSALEERAFTWLPEDIVDDRTFANLSAFMAQVRDHVGTKGEIEEARVKVKSGPLNATRVIDAFFNAERSPLLEWLQHADEWQKEYQRKKRANEPEAPRKITSTIGTTTTIGEVWDWEVTDFAKLVDAVSAGILPLSLLTYNEAAIRAAVRAKPPLRNTDAYGLKIWQDVKITRRG